MSWKKVKLGDVATEYIVRTNDPCSSGYERFVGSNHIGQWDLSIRDWGSTQDVTSAMKVFQPGDYLLVRRSLYASDFRERAPRADFAGVCSGDILTIRENPKYIADGFLAAVLNQPKLWDYVVANASGSITRRIKWKQLREYEFALPPLDEQRRIAEVLWAAWTTLEKSRELREKGERLRKTTIVQLYEKGVRNETRRKTRLGLLPSSWTISPLGNEYAIQLGKMMSKKALLGNNQVPYIRNANVQWNRLDLTDVASMNFDDREREKFSLEYGDIVACEGRHVGKSALWRDEIPGACYQKAVHRLRRKKEGHVPEYLLHCLQYYSWTGRFRAETGETTIPHLSAERFRKMLFPFPPPAEQRQIADRIADIDAMLVNVGNRTKHAGVLMSELLRQTLDPRPQE